MTRESRNARAMRSGQWAYDNAAPADDGDDELIATDDDFAEAKRRMAMRGKQPDGFTEYRLAEKIARGEA